MQGPMHAMHNGARLSGPRSPSSSPIGISHGAGCQLDGSARHRLSSPKQPSRRGRHEQLRRMVAGAVPHPSDMDLLVAQPTMDLIMRSAGDAASQIDTHVLNNVVHSLYHALGTGHDVASPLAQDSLSPLLQNHHAVAQEVHTVAQALPSVAVDATTAAAISAHAAQQQELASLATWAMDKLAVVQTMDPAAYESMSNSITGLMDALQATLQTSHPQPIADVAEAAALPWTNAVVLAVQQVVTSLRSPGAGGASIGSMVAAQEAMHAAMTSAAVEAHGLARAAGALTTTAGELPAGLNGLIQLVLALTAMVVASVPRHDVSRQSAGGSDTDQIPLRYDVPALTAYFSRRPMMVLQRNSHVISKLSSFCLTIIADWRMGRWEMNLAKRAATIRQIVEELGPAYIKIAQAVSTRVDIMPQVYCDEFAKLQDNVKRFSTVEARKVLEEGLGRSVDSVFEWLSEDPVAAASLGQVYRGKLRPEYGGGQVAVKVQRPGALESVALDIFIMRRSALLFSQLPGMSDKWAEALDDWALRFFLEMDYQLEAHNTMTFKQHMAGLTGVKVATVYPQLTSRKIIVTEWIEGERLGESKSEDVKALCSTLLNCYLIQLLETGLLHADPHPGNLMRTPDGKIVVLDFGLMTEVNEDQRIALVEYIAHLTSEDWEGVAKDLVTLGFLPDGIPPEDVPKLAPVMEKVMGQLVRGGGLKNGFSLGSIAGELSGVAMNYKMCVPPYFALVIRAFSVIEGIALKVDPNYAIVQECMPYMSRRLLSDNNPRMRAALRQLLYGKGTRLDVERVNRMLSSFSSFTTAAAPSRLATGPTFSAAAANAADTGSLLSVLTAAGEEGPILTEPVKEVLKVVFSKDGSYAQEILVDEAVAAIDAMSREAMAEALRLVTATLGTVAALRGVEALGPLRAMLMPLPLPTDVLHAMQPSVALTPEDRQALTTLKAVLELVVSPQGNGVGPGIAHAGVKAARIAGEVAPLLPELLPGMQLTLQRFVKQLVRRMALRLADDLDPTGAEAATQPAAGQAGQFSTRSSQVNQSTRQPPR